MQFCMILTYALMENKLFIVGNQIFNKMNFDEIMLLFKKKKKNKILTNKFN